MYVELKNIKKTFKDFKASDDVSFGIEKGKLIGLLGPSGSGKTTILRMIAGLETPDSGDIIIDGVRVNDIEAGKRGIGFVFQSYALFRHMTVFDNIAFGLNVQKQDKKKIKARVEELIKLIGLEGMEKRYPHQLSGGQRQRVAFARALAPNPHLLLLDEPFAAIDAKVRQELRTWLKKTISELNITSIFVTHDQDEAIEVADEIIVTNKGRIEQKGTPMEIYKNPKTPFVAQFIGESAVIEDYSKLKGFGDSKFTKAIVRPEFIQLAKNKAELKYIHPVEEGIVEDVAFRGSSIQITFKVGDITLTAYRSLEHDPIKVGDKVFALIFRLYVFNDTEAYILENNAMTDPMPVFI
ncbi:sulfate/molybdate ABC transporter ATP-binding protein [Clostridium cellulovorans]|uniref:ABC-type quaternary amine transporter n=1 Tax=Clostridium cellulovorans (strain ATCC 35296 / DSM 3052 / OCM 3 / 743B) TaxID=573061 RepID=D9SR11_CLOC7|nr:ABC transporter ATP-binding protein [Clostridium cellulovorans]ADL50299.1 sulfate ABC transporter, ATPase subunit [Clostridium cellulovorans 743B]